jgi:WD40 repeat protein
VANKVPAAPATTEVTAKRTRKLEGKCAKTWTGHTDWVNCVMQLADGRVCSGSYDKTIKIWDVGTGACAMTLDGTY